MASSGELQNMIRELCGQVAEAIGVVTLALDVEEKAASAGVASEQVNEVKSTLIHASDVNDNMGACGQAADQIEHIKNGFAGALADSNVPSAGWILGMMERARQDVSDAHAKVMAYQTELLSSLAEETRIQVQIEAAKAKIYAYMEDLEEARGRLHTVIEQAEAYAACL